MINVKIYCPECIERGKGLNEMYESEYTSPLKVLTKRVWYVCIVCKYSVESSVYWSKINGI